MWMHDVFIYSTYKNQKSTWETSNKLNFLKPTATPHAISLFSCLSQIQPFSNSSLTISHNSSIFIALHEKEHWSDFLHQQVYAFLKLLRVNQLHAFIIHYVTFIKALAWNLYCKQLVTFFVKRKQTMLFRLFLKKERTYTLYMWNTCITSRLKTDIYKINHPMYGKGDNTCRWVMR
jgi:hypothetical protein